MKSLIVAALLALPTAALAQDAMPAAPAAEAPMPAPPADPAMPAPPADAAMAAPAAAPAKLPRCSAKIQDSCDQSQTTEKNALSYYPAETRDAGNNKIAGMKIDRKRAVAEPK